MFTSVDYIIKTKCTLVAMKRKLMSDEVIVLDLVDGEFKDKEGKSMLTKDVYVTADVNGAIGYDVCQGLSKKLFGGYREGNAQTKEVEKGWYLVGLVHARVIDTNFAHEKAFARFDHVQLTGNRFAREVVISTSAVSGSGGMITRSVGISVHTFQLHRLVAIAAAGHGMMASSDGALEGVGLDLGDHSYDRIVDYRPLENDCKETAILRALRVGLAQS
jgi:hypothetical protein